MEGSMNRFPKRPIRVPVLLFGAVMICLAVWGSVGSAHARYLTAGQAELVFTLRSKPTATVTVDADRKSFRVSGASSEGGSFRIRLYATEGNASPLFITVGDTIYELTARALSAPTPEGYTHVYLFTGTDGEEIPFHIGGTATVFASAADIPQSITTIRAEAVKK